jgi:chromosome partitioning protein
LRAARDGGADLCVIDTAPHSGDDALAAAEASDLILIPCRPGILDLRAIGSTARVVKVSGKPGFVVLNTLPARAINVLADAVAAVAVHGLKVAPVALQQRAAYAHALTVGQAAQEYERSGKAAGEIGKLYAWISDQLAELPATRQSSTTAIRQE